MNGLMTLMNYVRKVSTIMSINVWNVLTFYLGLRPAGLITGKEITAFLEFCPAITTLSKDLKVNRGNCRPQVTSLKTYE